MNVFIYGSVYDVTDFKGHLRCYGEIMNSLLRFDEYYDLKKWDEEEFVEDCLVFAHKYWLHELAEEHQLERLKNIKNKKLFFISHGYSYCNNAGPKSLLSIKEKIESLGFELKNVYFLTQLPADIPVINKYLPGARVHHCDEWLAEFMRLEGMPYIHKLNQFKKRTSDTVPKKRFSILFRRYDENRLSFVLKLVANNLIEDFNYTFSNRYGMNLNEITSIEEMKTLIPSNLESSREVIENWMNGLPYEVSYDEGENFGNAYPINLRFYIQNSDINVVFETDPVSGNSTITEKTYKAMFYKKPFILVCHPHSVDILKKSGFKTFSPFIDESYDDIEDYNLRTDAIIKEITRIKNLSSDEMNQLLTNCAPIIEHNFKTLMNNYYTPLPDEFTLKGIMKDEF